MNRDIDRKPYAVIALPSSLFRSYLSYQTDEKPVYFMYPAHTRGIALGNTLTSAYLKMRARKEQEVPPGKAVANPRILLTGDGRHIYYMIETFITNLELLLPSDAVQNAKSVIDNDVCWMTAQEFIHKDWLLKTNHVFPAGSVGAAMAQFNVIPFEFRVKKAVRPTENTNFREHTIPVVRASSSEMAALAMLLEAIASPVGTSPIDIVVLAHSDIDQLLATYSTVFNVLGRQERLGSTAIIVGAESGIIDRLRNIGDGSSYHWASTSPAEQAPYGNYYPARFGYFSKSKGAAFGDCMVDVLEDAKEQVCGIIHSQRKSQEVNGLPVKLHTCTSNIPGTLSRLAGKLAGIRYDRWQQLKSDELLPSLSYARYVQQHSSSFALIAFASLSKESLEVDHPFAWRAFARTNVRGKREQERIDDLLSKLGLSRKCYDKRCENGCPTMAVCPVAAYQRHVKARAPRHAGDIRPSYYSAAPEQFQSNVFDLARKYSGLMKKRQDVAPFARITICCNQGGSFGALATSLNALRLHLPIGCEEFDGKAREVLDVSYLRDFNCYEDSVSLSTLYGQVRQVEKDEIRNRIDQLWPRGNAKAEPFIKAVLIRPSPSDVEKWESYAVRLVEFLNSAWQDEYELCPVKLEERIQNGVWLVIQKTLFDYKSDEWRVKGGEEQNDQGLQENQGNLRNRPEETPTRYHRCFCAGSPDRWNSRNEILAQPWDVCPLNKELEQLHGMGVLKPRAQ